MPTGTWLPSSPGIVGEGRGQPLNRVIYTESHDEVANGRVRVPEAIAPGDADNWFAQEAFDARLRARPDSSPGIPMLFQGQELLEDGFFDDTVPLDWDKTTSNRGVLDLHRDLIRLRRDRDGTTRGLRGPNVAILRADEATKVLAMHRWRDGGPHDDTVVVANFANQPVDDLSVGFPAPGRWPVRFNSDAIAYGEDFGSHEAADLVADGPPADGREQSAVGLARAVQRGDLLARGLTACVFLDRQSVYEFGDRCGSWHERSTSRNGRSGATPSSMRPRT